MQTFFSLNHKQLILHNLSIIMILQPEIALILSYVIPFKLELLVPQLK